MATTSRLLTRHGSPRREDLDALIGFAANYDILSEMLAQLVLYEQRDTELARGQPPKIRQSTIHQAKGL
jgi:superfamily I DNA/RNA helicase